VGLFCVVRLGSILNLFRFGLVLLSKQRSYDPFAGHLKNGVLLVPTKVRLRNDTNEQLIVNNRLVFERFLPPLTLGSL
jgi:hypothetical protein